jgi:MOSC domain-containing protein YiiM
MPGRVRLDIDAGVIGDKWIDGRNPKRHSQVTLMRYDVARVLTEGNEVAILGDNLFASIDTSAENLPPGSLLRVGSALCEVTHKPHEGCSKFAARVGEDAWKLTLADDWRPTQLRGVHLSVVESGDVGEGDRIIVLKRS